MKRKVERDNLVKQRLMKKQKLADCKGRMSRDEFRLGDKVQICDPISRRWNVEATVIQEQVSDNGRQVSFIIEFDDGKTSIRNKSHLRHSIKIEGKVEKKATSFSNCVCFSDGSESTLDDKMPALQSTRLRQSKERQNKLQWRGAGPVSD